MVLRLRRGTTEEFEAFIGAEGELTYDKDLKRPRIHDGVTPGGFLVHAALDRADDVVVGTGITNIVALWQTQYDALADPDPETLYVIIPMMVVMGTGSVIYAGSSVGLAYGP